jgi:type IV pilus biogenesis protein CpaD/CtpE
MSRRILAVLLAVLCAGCTVGPNYKRPATSIPATYRAPEPLPPSKAAELADLKFSRTIGCKG